jgi:dihydropteroate synthase
MGTAATVAIAIAHGADIVRVHDMAEMVQVCRMADAVLRSPLPGPPVRQAGGQSRQW